MLPHRRSRFSAATALLATVISCLPTVLLHGADGTWTLQPGGAGTSASGSWNTPGNWASGTTADGSGSTADFSTLDVVFAGNGTANNVITLDAPRTIGNIIFGDTNTATPGAWNLNAGTGTPSLNLAGATPTISVNSLGSGGFARINASITGSDGLIKEGVGMLVLAGSNSYTGTTQVKTGTLRLLTSNGSSNSFVISTGAVLNFDTVNVIFTADTSGGGSITKSSGVNTLSLLGNGTHTGGTALADGTIFMGTGTNNGLGTGTLSLNSGRLASVDNNSRTITNTLSMGSGGIAFGAAQDAATGLGNLTFTYAGTTSLGGSRTWTVNNATTATFNNNWTGNNTWNVTKAGTGTLVFNGNIATSSTVGVVVNAGVMILNGATNSYAGVTTVSGGKLLINGTKSGVGAVNVTSGTLGGTGSIAGLTSLSSGGHILGQSAGPLRFTGGLTLAATGGGILDYELGAVSAADLLSITAGTFTGNSSGLTQINITELAGFGAGVYTLANWTGATASDVDLTDFQLVNNTYSGGLTGSLQITGSKLELVVVPEPQLGALLLASVGLVALGRRRRTTRS